MHTFQSFRRSVLWTAALVMTFSGSGVAAPIFNFGSAVQSQGCSPFSSTTVGSGTATLQTSGGGICAVQVNVSQGGWNASIAPTGVTITGTGSGVFDGTFFPIGFNASGDIGGGLTATFSINGALVASGNGIATWDVANQLMGQTLTTWQVTISGGGGTRFGAGPPPMFIPNSFGYCMFFGTNSLCNTAQNNSATNPILPTNPGGGSSGGSTSGSSSGGPAPWTFVGVPSGRWTDPPFVNGFAYAGTGGTLFDRITLPTGYGNAFSVWTGGNLFGTFGAGAVVDFLAGGVSSFEIRDINPTVDAALPNAFPIQVFFEGGGNGDFTQTPLEDTATPEPATWLMLAAAIPVVLRRSRRR